MNLFDLGGQYLRVGRAITPPDTSIQGPPSVAPQVMPTAAAVAAAAATAKIQAMDAVATNLGLSSDNMAGSRSGSSGGGFGPPVSAAIPPPTVVAPVPVATSSREPSIPKEPPQYAAVPPPGVVVPAVAPPTVAVVAPVSVAAPVAVPAEALAPQAPAAPVASTSSSDHAATVLADAQKKQQEELQKKLMEGQEPSTLQQQENMSIKGQSARHLVMQKLMRAQSESVVVLLKNMVTPEEVDEELQVEIEEECAKFGEVERVIIYQEKQSEDENAEIIVKIFVEFKTNEAAKKAKESLNGRFFGGRRVVADIYDQDLYDHNDLSG